MKSRAKKDKNKSRVKIKKLVPSIKYNTINEKNKQKNIMQIKNIKKIRWNRN